MTVVRRVAWMADQRVVTKVGWLVYEMVVLLADQWETTTVGGSVAPMGEPLVDQMVAMKVVQWAVC